MAIRSRIGIVNNDGSIESIYCHFDGYISNNGRLLAAHYTTEEKVRELIDLGDLSSLGAEIGEQHDFENPGSRDWCRAYRRDRAETGCLPQHSKTTEDFLAIGEEYNYLFSPGIGEWVVNYGEGFRRVNTEILKKTA
jgi:hypothetical protein